LAPLPTSGPGWDWVKAAADTNFYPPDVSNQDSNDNVFCLAAGIVYARTGIQSYKDNVVAACEYLASHGKPGADTLAWARETGAYAMAADLVGYRTSAFETWLRNMAEVYVATDGRTMRGMFEARPNNWGTHGFGSLGAIYRYLNDTTELTEIRDYWIQLVVGPKPSPASYGSDISWHVDENNLRQINPQGSVKQGMNIDGVLPDDLRRGSSFKEPPTMTGYCWEALQGIVMAARVLDRAGMSIWNVDDQAIYRAAYCLQVRFATDYDPAWAATGDDLWMLPFLDKIYGTSWATGDPESREWDHGKNTGWAYVTLGE